MDRTYWHKQGKEPLFPELVWSRPENRAAAGKLLIVGGNAHGFMAAAEAYNVAGQAGIGTARVLLPDAIHKIVKGVFEAADFAPSTPSGSFSQKALDELLAHASWSDGVLLAGDLGRNSETAIVLEKFVNKYIGQITITKDAVGYFTSVSESVLNRPDTTLVLSMAQLQKLGSNANITQAITFDMDLLRLVDWLHDFTESFAVNIVTKHLDTIYASVSGSVSTTKTDLDNEESWRVPTASKAAVWWLQNPTKSFKALTTAVCTS